MCSTLDSRPTRAVPLPTWLAVALRLALVGLLVAVCTLAGSCATDPSADTPSRETCLRLRAHVAELEVAAAPRAEDDAEAVSGELAKHAQHIEQALGDAFVDDCQARRDGAYLGCAFDADTSSALAACNR